MSTEYEIQANYGYGDGWEMVDTVETLAEARDSLAIYNENEPQYPHRIKRVKS